MPMRQISPSITPIASSSRSSDSPVNSEPQQAFLIDAVAISPAQSHGTARTRTITIALKAHEKMRPEPFAYAFNHLIPPQQNCKVVVICCLSRIRTELGVDLMIDDSISGISKRKLQCAINDQRNNLNHFLKAFRQSVNERGVQLDIHISVGHKSDEILVKAAKALHPHWVVLGSSWATFSGNPAKKIQASLECNLVLLKKKSKPLILQRTTEHPNPGVEQRSEEVSEEDPVSNTFSPGEGKSSLNPITSTITTEMPSANGTTLPIATETSTSNGTTSHTTTELSSSNCFLLQVTKSGPPARTQVATPGRFLSSFAAPLLSYLHSPPTPTSQWNPTSPTFSNSTTLTRQDKLSSPGKPMTRPSPSDRKSRLKPTTTTSSCRENRNTSLLPREDISFEIGLAIAIDESKQITSETRTTEAFTSNQSTPTITTETLTSNGTTPPIARETSLGSNQTTSETRTTEASNSSQSTPTITSETSSSNLATSNTTTETSSSGGSAPTITTQTSVRVHGTENTATSSTSSEVTKSGPPARTQVATPGRFLSSFAAPLLSYLHSPPTPTSQWNPASPTLSNSTTLTRQDKLSSPLKPMTRLSPSDRKSRLKPITTTSSWRENRSTSLLPSEDISFEIALAIAIDESKRLAEEKGDPVYLSAQNSFSRDGGAAINGGPSDRINAGELGDLVERQRSIYSDPAPPSRAGVGVSVADFYVISGSPQATSSLSAVPDYNSRWPYAPSAPPLPLDGRVQYPVADTSPIELNYGFTAESSDCVHGKLKQKQEAEHTPRGLCVICWDAPAEVACIPCGHIAGCKYCLTKAKKWGCPVCRTKIQQILKLYAV